ncbi:MAG: hypothetical protein NTX87_20850 [Planctomycetota bacterium]|nr:hypothetical protein [Planctomycetota bacterium]
MRRYGTRDESPRPFAAQADPEALPLPRGPDSRIFRLLLNGGEPYLRRVAELVRRLWIKQRPREDAETILVQVMEDLIEERYALRHLAAYLDALPLVASPCRRLAEMIAVFYGFSDDEVDAAGAPEMGWHGHAPLRDRTDTAAPDCDLRGGSPDPPRNIRN